MKRYIFIFLLILGGVADRAENAHLTARFYGLLSGAISFAPFTPFL